MLFGKAYYSYAPRHTVRPQMAEAFLNHFYGDRCSALSAGPNPSRFQGAPDDLAKEYRNPR